MSKTLIIDDSDPSIQYDSGWSLAKGPGYGRAYNSTLHRVTDAGQSLSVVFHGTGIQVVTMRQPSANAGYPVTAYYLNGTYVGTITTPFVPDGPSQSNATVFAKRDLSLGTHVLGIINQNGTRPSTFWLDYFVVDIVPVASATGTPAAASSSSHPSSTRIPAIVGGVAAALLAVVAVVLGCLWRRRRQRARRERVMRANVQPYVPVVRIISQYRASLHSLDKVPPSLVEGTLSPSVSTPDVRTAAADTGGFDARTGNNLATHDTKLQEAVALTVSHTPTSSSLAEFPRSPAPLLVVDSHAHLTPTTAGTVPQSPPPGLVLPDELGRALSGAPPEVRSGVISFMHTLLMQGGQQQRIGSGAASEVDSGVRMYDDEYVPPPQYTTQ